MSLHKLEFENQELKSEIYDHKHRLSFYEEEIQRLYFQVNRSGMFTFLGVGMAVAIFAIDGEFSHSEVMDNFVGIISAASAVTNATIGTKRIVERELLKQDARQLEVELANDELENPEKPKVYSKKLQDKNIKLWYNTTTT